MHTILLASTFNEAESFAQAAGINKAAMTIPRDSAAIRALRLHEDDVILQFHSFKDHPERGDIEGELLVKLAHFGAGPKPKWARAGQ